MSQVTLKEPPTLEDLVQSIFSPSPQRTQPSTDKTLNVKDVSYEPRRQPHHACPRPPAKYRKNDLQDYFYQFSQADGKTDQRHDPSESEDISLTGTSTGTSTGTYTGTAPPSTIPNINAVQRASSVADPDVGAIVIVETPPPRRRRRGNRKHVWMRSILWGCILTIILATMLAFVYR